MSLGIGDFVLGTFTNIAVNIDHENLVRHINFSQMNLSEKTLLFVCKIGLKPSTLITTLPSRVSRSFHSSNSLRNLIDPHKVITFIGSPRRDPSKLNSQSFLFEALQIITPNVEFIFAGPALTIDFSLRTSYFEYLPCSVSKL